MVAPGIWVDGPAITPVTGGIITVAPPRDITDPHAVYGINWESEIAGAGGFVIPNADDCNGPTGVKSADGFQYVEGTPFPIYHGVKCKPIGDNADYLAHARRNLELNEGFLIEQRLWNKFLPDAATDLNPAGAVKPKIALGLLAEYAGTQYRGVPVLHFGRRLGVYLAGEQLVKQDESDAAAAGGAQYVNGAGYTSLAGPGGVTAAASEAWCYITGQLALWHTPVVANETFDPAKNTALAIAERTIIASVESFVVGIRVSLE